MTQSAHAPSKEEIEALLKKSGLKLFEKDRGGIRIVTAGNSVYVGEFNAFGVQQRPGPKLQQFIDGLPAHYFSPSQAHALVKPGRGSAGEIQRKFTSVRARVKAMQADPQSYLGFEVIDKKKPSMPANIVNASAVDAASKTPRAITYVKKVKTSNDGYDLMRHIILSEAYFDGSKKRVDEVHISYTLSGTELELFGATDFDEKLYIRNGGYSGLGIDGGIAVSGLSIGVHDPNLEFESAADAARHFEKTSKYLHEIAKSLFGANGKSYLAELYGIPILLPEDWVKLVAHDQVRTKEWLKIGAKGVSTATLGRLLETVQDAIIDKDAYRKLDEMTRTMVSMAIYMDPDDGWSLLKPEVVLQGKYKGSEAIETVVNEFIKKQGPNLLQYVEGLTSLRRR